VVFGVFLIKTYFFSCPFAVALKNHYIRMNEMCSDTMFELLASLCGCDCVSGRESGLHKQILDAGSFDRHATDALGNLLCFKDAGPDAATVLLDAHADEIGLIVRHIDKEGFIFADAVGGIDPKVLQGTCLTVHGTAPMPAVVGDLPPHLSQEKKVIPLADLPIDTGRSAKEVRESVRIGDAITFRSGLARIGANQVTGKALDNRAGVAALCELSRIVRSPCNIMFSFSSQEEVGARGVIPALFGKDISLAICVDTTHGDMPGVDQHKTRPLGTGPIIGRGPGIHPGVGAAVEAAGDRAGIAYSVKAYPGTMPTNLRSIQVSGKGIPGAQVSIPARYLHTPSEIVDLRDVRGCVELLAAFLSDPPCGVLEGI
jgi:endoglucanase